MKCDHSATTGDEYRRGVPLGLICRQISLYPPLEKGEVEPPFVKGGKGICLRLDRNTV
jgi:hypothetical protein